jgi:hypothetical protein
MQLKSPTEPKLAEKLLTNATVVQQEQKVKSNHALV